MCIHKVMPCGVKELRQESWTYILTKIPVPGKGNLPSCQSPQTVEAIAIALGCLP